jgi:hypothetical protein
VNTPARRPPTRRALLLATALLGLLPATPARAQDDGSRQVTLFGILATPNDDQLDPKLRPIERQLRTLFPGHGFKLLGVETRRLNPSQSLGVRLGPGFEGSAQLLNPQDVNGKCQLRFQLDQNGQLDFATLVTTPLNQLSFLDKLYPDGSRLVVGIGVRP